MTFPDVHMAVLAADCRDKFFRSAPDADVVVTTDRRHIGYLTGYHGITHNGTARYAQAAIATRSRVAIVTGASDAAAALEIMGDVQAIWRYGTFYVSSSDGVPGYADMPASEASFEEAVLNCLASFRPEKATIALDVQWPKLEPAIKGRFAGATYCPALPGLVLARSVKLPGELELLRYASRITDEAVATALADVSPTLTEFDISSTIQAHIVRQGGIPKFTVVTSGERSSRVDAFATPRVVGDGATVRLDVGCTVNGYASDMARTIVVGEPTAKQATRYQALLDGEQAQINLIRPGIAARDLYNIAVETVRRGALPTYQRNHCGHGIGLTSHEYPMLDAEAEAILAPGMVLCVETPYYELGWGGMMVEDTAIVTETGHELLTTSSRDLVPLRR